MRHTVKMQGLIVGHSELEQRDAAARRAWGRFRPGMAYELVQPIFRLFTEAVPMRGGEPRDEEKLARYHSARDKLGLELVDADGRRIDTAAIHIADYTERQGREALELEVLVRDEEFWGG
ncbi:MAG: hypothetical protein HOQ17_11200 [Gemmatimonadaceae bacterium]|nr:hypothetical protein [Gemmatimonadaceae bacterium]NUO95704.1 hypothetical protein [Gemmatimonadaceae bacterium]NUP54252.1 hypothetical protein [Gemmatimonadaceae bacterium]NUS33620.1 hypothetical protein [Gemmatimonadaceae bacterium]NUS46291.1 hypothetical protein [Gemmatimonadaceae bacterium]